MSDRNDALRAAGGGPRPFHLALPVHDLGAAEGFYAGLLGAATGRRSERWIDFDLGGHQITVHLADGLGADGLGADAGERGDPEHANPKHTNPVDGDRVPIPHFGVVLDMPGWRALAGRLTEAGCDFVIAPRVRFEGQPGEQGTLFLRDPSGNALEFKGFAAEAALFDDAGAY